jgi:hypothetical protein
LHALLIQGLSQQANIIQGQTSQRPTLSECVRSSHPVRVFPLIENFSVVNPSIRMTWIMNNWEKEWSDKAVGIIQGLVSIVWFHEIIYY